MKKKKRDGGVAEKEMAVGFVAVAVPGNEYSAEEFFFETAASMERNGESKKDVSSAPRGSG